MADSFLELISDPESFLSKNPVHRSKDFEADFLAERERDGHWSVRDKSDSTAECGGISRKGGSFDFERVDLHDSLPFK